jgi:SAM-dependent methyltransferase
MENFPRSPFSAFSSKAEKYARYRWDYAPQAIETIFSITGLNEQKVVADIGAGPGILTRHFMGRVHCVYAVEPNVEMRGLAVRFLASDPTCRIVEGCAEATGLPDHSVDLVTAATATNWFDPLPARAEFLRILKPGGWLAIVRNFATNREVGEALEAVYPTETDTAELMKGIDTPKEFYFGRGDFQKFGFEFTISQTWDKFFGALCTASYAPDEDNPWFDGFEQGSRQVFERFSRGGFLISHAVTEVLLGKPE